MKPALAVALLLAGCQSTTDQGGAADDAGTRLERAAVAAGLVVDPAGRSIVGSWANDTDRLCVVPAGKAARIGVLIDYGAGLGCVGSGTVARRGGRLTVDLGRDCRFDGSFSGERIAFPAQLPGGCDRLCTGRATLSALRVARLSASPSEAESLRTPDQKLLCGS